MSYRYKKVPTIGQAPAVPKDIHAQARVGYKAFLERRNAGDKPTTTFINFRYGKSKRNA